MQNKNQSMALIINRELIENQLKIADFLQQEKEDEEDHSVKINLSKHADLYHNLQRLRVYKILLITH